MDSSEKDYYKLFLLQDKFLDWWQYLDLPFYLTGGTALGRFYLNHRFSEYLDFFINNDDQFPQYIEELRRKITSRFALDMKESLFTDDFTRIYISDDDSFMKIEFVNDVGYRIGEPEIYEYGKIDTPKNILSNKLNAIIGRDEPKDMFDIIYMAINYSFNWQEIFYHAKQKAVINELDVVQRFISFPVEWLKNVSWLNAPIDSDFIRKIIVQIADDFLFGKPNSAGKDQPPIEMAKPIKQK